MSAKRFLVAFLASAVLCGGTAGAVTLDWEDLTNAQQKKAYLDLEEENKTSLPGWRSSCGQPA